MEIQIDLHTLERAVERGTNESEIKDVIQTGLTISAKHGRIGKAKVYDFKQNRHNKYYEQKKVEVYYLIGVSTSLAFAGAIHLKIKAI